MIQDIYPHHFDNSYHPGEKPTEESYILNLRHGDVLVRILEGNAVQHPEEQIQTGGQDGTILSSAQAKEVHFPRRKDFPNVKDEAFIYLFSIDEKPYFLYDLRLPEDKIPKDYQYIKTSTLREKGIGPKVAIFTIITGLHLANWYRKNRYCGCCASPTKLDSEERALRCPVCQNVIYPRIVPAVIVGVINGDKLLLTKYARGFRPYAMVAGFTEIGETLEECVEREVMEEVGLKVKNIRYYKSQPWGVADDILAGYYCDVDGSTEIQMDKMELKLAEWKSRDEIELQPDDFSLTNEMMLRFKRGEKC